MKIARKYVKLSKLMSEEDPAVRELYAIACRRSGQEAADHLMLSISNRCLYEINMDESTDPDQQPIHIFEKWNQSMPYENGLTPGAIHHMKILKQNEQYAEIALMSANDEIVSTVAIHAQPEQEIIE